MCLWPNLILNRKYKANKKNGGKPPTITDERVKYVPIGCGNCIECSKQKARSWQIRLLEEVKQSTNGKFITLTFSNESIQHLSSHEKCINLNGYELDNGIATLAIRQFLERWRKKYKKSLRHFFVTELGHEGTENIHLHGIVWTNESFETIRQIWNGGKIPNGFMWPRREEYKTNFVDERTVNYIIKYITKKDHDHKCYKSIILTSPGIGNNYTKSRDFEKHTYKGINTIDLYRTSTGHKMSLPIYYRNKAFTEHEREQLWLHRLDKNERWVCGEKFKADDHDGYWRAVKKHRERNINLGYGNDEKNWDRENYENQRRKILHEKRKNAVKNQEGWQASKDAIHKPPKKPLTGIGLRPEVIKRERIKETQELWNNSQSSETQGSRIKYKWTHINDTNNWG